MSTADVSAASEVGGVAASSAAPAETVVQKAKGLIAEIERYLATHFPPDSETGGTHSYERALFGSIITTLRAADAERNEAYYRGRNIERKRQLTKREHMFDGLIERADMWKDSAKGFAGQLRALRLIEDLPTETTPDGTPATPEWRHHAEGVNEGLRMARAAFGVDRLVLTDRYVTGEAPKPGDGIFAGDDAHQEEFVTVVRRIERGGEYLTTAGWPEQRFLIARCRFVERGTLSSAKVAEHEEPAQPATSEA